MTISIPYIFSIVYFQNNVHTKMHGTKNNLVGAVGLEPTL
jgi:hypothetical protein